MAIYLWQLIKYWCTQSLLLDNGTYSIGWYGSALIDKGRKLIVTYKCEPSDHLTRSQIRPLCCYGLDGLFKDIPVTEIVLLFKDLNIQ